MQASGQMQALRNHLGSLQIVTERSAGPFIGIERQRNGNTMPEFDTAECRRMAEYYLACANQMSDPADKAKFLELAKYWTRAAEQIEQRQSGQGPTS
jgi:hypothetical protein